MDQLNFEVLDDNVKRYARSETEKFYHITEMVYSNARSEMEKIVYQKKMRLAEIGDWGEAYVTVENGKNCIVVNQKHVYSTESIIIWIRGHKTIEKIAFFETSGSDYGTMKILENGKIVFTEVGWIHDYIFAKTDYVIKENRKENVGEANEVTPGIYKGDEKVFYSEIQPGMGVQATVFGERIYLVVGDNIKSSIYSGDLNEPSSWKLYKRYDSQASVISDIDGIPSVLIRNGNGKVETKVEVIDFSNPVEDVVSVSEGYLAMEMVDSKIIPVLYDRRGSRRKEFKLNFPAGIIFLTSDDKRAICILSSFDRTYSIHVLEGLELRKVDENVVLDASYQEGSVNYKDIRVHYFYLKAAIDSKNTVIYGYGGFNIAIFPSFNNLFAYLLKNGVNVVVCNLPGGSEYGEEWHNLGRREKKGNVFGSFTEIIKKFNSMGHRIICYGVSNGGLLSSYTLMTVPELLTGAIIGNPVIDLMKFHKLLAGMYWVSEYGNPDEPDDAKFMEKFSPMHLIENRKYPPSLVYTRMMDDRVHPYHALKFHEKLNETGSNSLIMVGEGGHIGSTVKETTDETSRIAAFVSMVFRKEIG